MGADELRVSTVRAAGAFAFGGRTYATSRDNVNSPADDGVLIQWETCAILAVLADDDHLAKDVAEVLGEVHGEWEWRVRVSGASSRATRCRVHNATP